jgi:hypothetical protein
MARSWRPDAACACSLARAGAGRHPQFLTSLDSHQMVRPAAVPVRPVEKSRPKNRRQDHSCFVLHHRRAARCWRRPPYSQSHSAPRRRANGKAFRR